MPCCNVTPQFSPAGITMNMFVISYESRDGTEYDSSSAPTNAGDYRIIFEIPESNANVTKIYSS